MLDDAHVISRRDSQDLLGDTAMIYYQLSEQITINEPEHDGRPIQNIVLICAGRESTVAATMAKKLVQDALQVPIEIVCDYQLPAYVHQNSLLIFCSYPGDAHETVLCMEQALASKSTPQIAVIAAGQKMRAYAKTHHMAHIELTPHTPGVGATPYITRCFITMLAVFSYNLAELLTDITTSKEWLHGETRLWEPSIPTADNYAKQLALTAVGKTPLFYAGPCTQPVADALKNSWNNYAKNLAFTASYPNAHYHDLTGWTSHPIEKPFAIFDIWSDLEHVAIKKGFQLTDALLSGKRPKANIIQLQGESYAQQLLWGYALAEFAGLYAAILNGVNPAKHDTFDHFTNERGAAL